MSFKPSSDIALDESNSRFRSLDRGDFAVFRFFVFAGPGEYTGGEEGSPLIAIRAIMDHRIKLKSEFKLTFIEADKDRCAFLARKMSGITLPPHVTAGCNCGRFDEVMTAVLDRFEKEGSILAPAFVFVDPFGFAGVRFR